MVSIGVSKLKLNRMRKSVNYLLVFFHSLGSFVFKSFREGKKNKKEGKKNKKERKKKKFFL